MILLMPVAVRVSTDSWMIAANAIMSFGSAGAIPTFPGTERLPSSGVVTPTTPIFLPRRRRNNYALRDTVRNRACFLTWINNQGREIAIKTKV